MSEGLGVIAKLLYIIAVIVIAHGAWQVRSGNADMGNFLLQESRNEPGNYSIWADNFTDITPPKSTAAKAT